MATKNDVKKFVMSQKEGSVVRTYTPTRFLTLDLWEVWVWDDGEYKTRFVAEHSGGKLEYFDDFKPLVLSLSGICEKLISEATLSSSSNSGNTEELESLRAQAARFAQQADTAIRRAKDLEHDLKEAKRKGLMDIIKLCVASVGFLASLLVLFYLVAFRIEQNWYLLVTFAGLVASGSYMFFGNWRGPKIEKWSPPTSAEPDGGG
ncbi:MAG TPA: hypothetical protein PKD86_09650 [Gemmatales bacterium]|nr:hypothetical protein [Gemmatales bacterium]HMP59605.1 hypothetical protein [Gemmatales bacterium]